jgi:hypothetical protein
MAVLVILGEMLLLQRLILEVAVVEMELLENQATVVQE